MRLCPVFADPVTYYVIRFFFTMTTIWHIMHTHLSRDTKIHNILYYLVNTDFGTT